jgi:GntR family transcriptional regulator/MocR family aminotransferase
MPPRGGPFVPALPPRVAGTAAYRWLAAGLRGAILEGRLAPGARLPSTRLLADHFELSRGTVVSAFEELVAEGYLEGESGSGTFVNRVLPDDFFAAPRPPAKATPAPARKGAGQLTRYARQVEHLETSEPTPPHAFRANEPALDLFPAKLWAQIAGRVLRRGSTIRVAECDPRGVLPLRQAIAEYLGASRGVRCTTDQIAIVSGIQDALDLTTRLLVEPGDIVCTEEPGYVGADRVFTAAGATIRAIPVDEHGMIVPSARMGGARLAYVTPAHQFPTGVLMSLPRRLALLDWAQRNGAWIFEDDYDSEFRYSGRPIPALQGLDRSGSVLFAGSFSKVLFPSLRMGYLVVPEALVDRFAAARSVRNRHSPLLEQEMLAEFIAAGHFGRHLRRMREIYAERSATLVAEATAHWAGRLDVSPIEAGLQTAAWLTGGQAASAVAQRAALRGLEATPLSNYQRSKPTREGLHLGFAAIPPSEIRRGVRELARVLDEGAHG